MKRWHEEVAVARRQQRTWQRFATDHSREVGRFRKKHALDCGNTRCTVCHNYKAWHRGQHEPTRQEEKMDASEREMRQEGD